MTRQIKWIDKVTAANGSTTGKVTTLNNQTFLLHSCYNPEKEATDWVKSINLTPDTAYIVCGFGLGYHVWKLADQLPENCLMIVIENEQQDNFFQYAIKMIPETDPKKKADERVHIMFGPDIPGIGGYIAIKMRAKKIKRVTICRHYPSVQVYADFYSALEQEIIEKTRDLYDMNMGFSLLMGRQYLENSWNNMPYVWSSPSVKQLYDQFTGKPAIIVSSGPSLSKCAETIKEYQDKAIVIASGSALGGCRKYGITPDFLAVVDSMPIMYDVLQGKFQEDTVLLCMNEAYHKIITEYPGKRFFYNQSHYDILKEINEFLPESDIINHSLSVATTAFDIALKLGADPIIFVGQDLAFTEDDVRYADGCKDPALNNDFKDFPNEKCKYVQGQNGKMLRTVPVFAATLEYFVTRLRHIQNRTVINASTGGAYIDGMKHMTFQEAADQYLTENIDVSAVVDEAIQQFKPSNINELYKKLQEIEVATQEAIAGLTDKLQAVTDSSFEVALNDEKLVAELLERIVECAKYSLEHPVYRYVKQAADPVWEIFMYQQRDGLTDADNYSLYHVVLKHIIYLLKEFGKYLEQGMAGLQEQAEAVGLKIDEE